MGLETNKWCFIEFRRQPAWAGGGLLDNARVSNYKNYRVLDKDIHPWYTPPNLYNTSYATHTKNMLRGTLHNFVYDSLRYVSVVSYMSVSIV